MYSPTRPVIVATSLDKNAESPQGALAGGDLHADSVSAVSVCA